MVTEKADISETIVKTMTLNHDSLSPAIQHQEKVTQTDRTVTTSNELDLLFSSMFNELLNGSSKVVYESSDVSVVDAPNQQTYAKNDQVADDEFINIFSNPVQDQGETSTRHVNSSDMHTFYQRCPLSLHQREERFQYLIRRLGMRCLTSAELEALANESA
nr:hypothetical protein [Tanacetum cinerariifolium]